MFDSDRPISQSSEDRLGRNVFAKYLARSMLDHTNPQSLVVGLYGGWGVGKTSVINLALEELRFASSNLLDEEKPIILNFSPWSYSGQGQLIYSFFRRLSSELRQSPYLENKRKIIYLLELYVSFFTHKPIPYALRARKPWYKKLFPVFFQDEDSYGWESGRDLTLVKAELNDLLLKQKHKLIIIIDNIARLENTEIKQIFQIVKSIGDFSNTIYLLAIDKEYVIKAINQLQGSGGEESVEKLVQLPFDIPAISKQDLENILFDRLKNVIDLVPKEAWNSDYWADIYYSTLKNFFESCRDITRYVNTLGFSYARVKEIVNPVDFFSITALRVFERKVYYGIRDNKDLFTDLVDNVYLANEEQLAKDKVRCEEILNRTERIPRNIVQQLLLRLFPRLRGIYQSTVPFYHSEALARKNRNVCSPDVFDAYFRLTMPSGFIPKAEVDAILALAKNEESFSESLSRLNQDERIQKFLDYLDAATTKDIPLDNISNIINALIDNADLFPRGEQSALRFNTPMRVHRIVHQLLQRFDQPQKRYELLRDAIKKADKSLYIIVHELNSEEEVNAETEETALPLEQRDLTPEQLNELKKLAVAKIEFWASLGRLAEHPYLLPILYGWKTWANPENVKRFVMDMTQNDKGLVTFLSAALHDPIEEAMTKLEKNPDWANSLKNIEDFISIQIIEPHAKMLFEDLYFEKLPEREQLAILIFLDLIKAETVKIIPQTSV